ARRGRWRWLKPPPAFAFHPVHRRFPILPMKPISLLFTGSLLANAALVAVFAFQPVLAPPAVRRFFTSSPAPVAAGTGQTTAPQTALSRATKAATAKAAAEAQVWES